MPTGSNRIAVVEADTGDQGLARIRPHGHRSQAPRVRSHDVCRRERGAGQGVLLQGASRWTRPAKRGRIRWRPAGKLSRRGSEHRYPG